MKINGTLATKSGSWNQVKKHVDRNWVHDKNENSVDKSLSKYNLHDKNETIEHTDDKLKNRLLRYHYGKFVDERNAHFKRQGHAKRCQSLDDYLKGKVPTAIGIATAGTLDDKISMRLKINEAYSNRSKAENNKRYYQASSWAMKRYVHGFNKRNPRCPIYHWWTNVDELGAPHVHFAMVPLGYTKLDKNGQPTKATKKAYKSGKRKGQLHRVAGSKPTGDLTKAIEMQFGTNDRRKAFKYWNDQETKAIVRDFGSTFHQRFGKVKDWNKPFERQHTGRKGSLSMKSYKATWAKFDQIERKQNQRKQSQDHRKINLESRELALSNQEKAFTPKKKAYEHYSNRLPVLISENHNLSINNNNLKSKNKDLIAKNSDLDSRIRSKNDNLNKLNNRQNRLQQHIQRLQNKYNHMKNWLKNKWIKFRKEHLNGYYHGIAKGIKYMFGLDDNEAMNEATKGNGMATFLKGLDRGSSIYYQKMKSTKNIHKSFLQFNMERSPYWQGFLNSYHNNNPKDNLPNPTDKDYLEPFHRYAITQDERKYAWRHNNSLAGFEFNKSERKINNEVGANPNDENNYSKPCYAHGVDDPNDTLQK